MTDPNPDGEVVPTRLVRADAEGIDRCARALVEGELVAFPTETVYGLGADASSSAAVAAVFDAKQRPRTDPLIVHVQGIDAAAELGELDLGAGHARALVERFWPGPLTVVVPGRPGLAPEVSMGDTIGLRCPAHPVALALLAAAGVAVAAPSANRFGRVSPTTAQHVLEELGGRIAWVLDGGPTPLGVESTVVAIEGDAVRLLRPGGVPVEDLAEALGRDVSGEGVLDLASYDGAADLSEPAPGPGMSVAHYSPSVPVVLCDAGVGVAAELVARLRAEGLSATLLELPAGDAAANQLYGRLRALDRSDAELAVAVAVDPAGLGRAVNDRLLRAAHGHLATDASDDTLRRIRVRLLDDPAG